MTLPLVPPGRWSEPGVDVDHEPVTEPCASIAPPAPPGIDLSRTPGVLALVREAETHAIAGGDDQARRTLRIAALSIARIVGCDALTVEAIGDLLNAGIERGEDYAQAIERGIIVTELARPYSHERDTREAM